MRAESGTVYLAVETYFEEENVVVTVPTQAVRRVLSIVLLDPDPNELPATPNVFEPTRRVINFEVRESDGEALVQKFSPPMVLQVGIGEDELGLVAAGYELKLAYWDGSRWVVFTKEEHQLEFHSDFAIVLVRHWGDATVGWGR